MPTPTTWVYPKPQNWDEFENIVWDLFRRSWQDPDAQRYGRSGQEQHGIDVFGRPKDLGGDYVGVQCKRYEDEKVDEKIIRGEISKLEAGIENGILPFKPAQFVIVTTASRDKKLQDAIIRISRARVVGGGFPVSLRFWEDLSDMLSSPGYEDILHKHYPTLWIRDESKVAREIKREGSETTNLSLAMAGTEPSTQSKTPGSCAESSETRSKSPRRKIQLTEPLSGPILDANPETLKPNDENENRKPQEAEEKAANDATKQNQRDKISKQTKIGAATIAITIILILCTAIGYANDFWELVGRIRPSTQTPMPVSNCRFEIYGITPSKGKVYVNEQIELTAQVNNPDGINLIFNWVPSDGTILNGINTPSLEVRYIAPSYRVDDVISIQAFTPNCPPAKKQIAIQIIPTEVALTFKENSTVQAFPPAAENEALVIIVPFAGSMKDFSVYPERYVRDALQERVSRLNTMGQLTRLEMYSKPLDNQREARQMGEDYKATLVIWGEFDDIGGMRVYVEILSNIPKRDSQQSSNWTPLITLPINGGEVNSVSRECAVEGMPDQADYLTVISFGMLDLVQGKLKEAEELFTQAIDVIKSVDACKNSSHQAHYWRGLARSLQGNYSFAISDLNEALLLEPQNRQALAQRGEVYLTVGRATESESDLRAALTLFYPEEKEGLAVLYDNLGVALMLQGKYDESANTLDQARQIIVETNDELMIALNLAHLGNLQQLTKQVDDALANYNQALTICQEILSGPCEAILQGNIGSIFQAKGDLETALLFYRKALTIANQSQFVPGQVMLIIKIGNACLEKKELICARENYSNASNIAEQKGLLYNFAQAQIGLAMVEEQLGNKNIALEKLQVALQILEDIDSPDADAVHKAIQDIQP